MKNYTLTLIIILLCSIISFSKITKVESSKETLSINLLNEHLKGFEADYLSKKEFRLQVKQKKFWGIVEFIIDLVASLFNDSYGEYNDDTMNTEGFFNLIH